MDANQGTKDGGPRVFISYSHDSRAHCDKVLELAQELRHDGIDAELDQFHQEELVHWPRWCEEKTRSENSDFVLCVCTEEYKRRIEGRASADVGRGVYWEGTLIYDALYDEKVNRRFIPILLGEASGSDIPSVLRGYTRFRLRGFSFYDEQSDYFKLYRLLTGQPCLEKAELGEVLGMSPIPMYERRTDFMRLIEGRLEKIGSDTKEIIAILKDSSTEHWTSDRPHNKQLQFPNDADLVRMKAMATTLLEAGKRSWKMPRFVAPLTLEAHLRQDDQQTYPINTSELSSAIEAGDSLVLFGEGGIGKTTFLLDLCRSCMNGGRRIPLYVDAAVWARTNATLFEYLVSLPSAQGNGVTPVELTKLAEAGRLVIMLNGWNEISASSKLGCRDGLIHLTAAADALSVVVVSRASNDTPGLPNAMQIEVRGLTWHGQSAVVRAELGDGGAAPLLDLLAKNSGLRRAARSPLILRGLIAQAKNDALAYSSVYDLLGAAVQALEEDHQRRLVLSAAPVNGHQRAYLEEVACLLTQRMATNCCREDALQGIHSSSTRLAERRLIGALPNLASVLDVLVSHHLLHLDDGVVRFAHQRFQEYFAATRLLRECIEDVVPPALLRTAVNQPAWHESLVLAAGKLKGKGSPAAARVRMVKAAAEIDLGLACNLARICAFSEADDSELYQHLVARVNELAASSLAEVRDLGVAYQITSGLPIFAEKLWPLLESEDQQTRLHTYRLNGSDDISLAQLGSGAEQRVASWSPERRAEFVHEISGNMDNYEFLVALARSDPAPSVQAAAISALFWQFPASDVALEAWLHGPIAVQAEHEVVSWIRYALEEGYAGDAVRERLQNMAIQDLSEEAQLRLALAFPNEVGPRALDVVFGHLRSRERKGDDAPLVAIAQANAPQRLLCLAQELAVQARAVPYWVAEYLLKAPANVRTDVFELAWTTLQGQEFENLSSEVLGPLADRSQIERSVVSWLQYADIESGMLTDIDRKKHWRLRDILAHGSGGELLNVVMQRGQAASYNEASQLLEFVLARIQHNGTKAATAEQWLPTVEEVRKLVAMFADKAEAAEVPQDTVRVHLCCVASYVAPAQFGSLMLETCRRNLDAWSSFREKSHQRPKRATSIRVDNPRWGHYLSSAVSRWGSEALPGLLELISHPSAIEFIPHAIARIVSLPWAGKMEGMFRTIRTDVEEGENRRRAGREFRQPDDTYQHWTDEAAKAVGQKLSELVKAFEEKKATDEKWNVREAEHRIGRLAGAVASIPSGRVVEPVYGALASGLMDIYSTIMALRSLLCQGLHISDRRIVRQMEALHEQALNAKCRDKSLRYAISELSELLFCVVPASLLSKPASLYLQQWRQFSSPREIIRNLGAIRSEAVWPALLELGGELAEEGRPPEEIVSALSSSLAPQHLNEFLTLVADGTLFGWCRSDRILERVAPRVAAVVAEAAGQVEAFVQACRKAQSPLADAFAAEVLSNIKGSEKTRQSYLLEALEAGRAVHSNMSAYWNLRGMFKRDVPIGDTTYEVTPKASNQLRTKLYSRAKESGTIADGCRRLLASLELERRENSRPDDEPRHPAPEEGVAWTDVLLSRR